MKRYLVVWTLTLLSVLQLTQAVTRGACVTCPLHVLRDSHHSNKICLREVSCFLGIDGIFDLAPVQGFFSHLFGRRKRDDDCHHTLHSCTSFRVHSNGEYHYLQSNEGKCYKVKTSETHVYCDRSHSTTANQLLIKHSTLATTVKSCTDVLSNCNLYPLDDCIKYPEWAKTNCPVRCGICSGHVTTTLQTPPPPTPAPPTPKPPCKDVINNCNLYPGNVCTTYVEWAKSNCALTCGICHGTTPTTATTLQSTTLVPTPPFPLTIGNNTAPCLDVNAQCHVYPIDDCIKYMDWAKTNCALTCGYCQAATTAVWITAKGR